MSRVFQRVGSGRWHVAVSSAEEFILVSRNLEQWQAGARTEAVDPGIVRNRLAEIILNLLHSVGNT